MKSSVSFFDRGVCRNLLRRCWPLWVGYFVLLLFLLPVQLAQPNPWNDETTAMSLQRLVLNSADDMIPLSFFTGILTAMVAFGYLYNSRSCGLMNSLPLRRETMFLTAWCTGLAPMLLAELLTALLTGALYLGRGLPLQDLLTWLLAAVCANLCFYGIAAFCAMLTGSLLMLPVAYLALNLAAWAAEDCLRALLRALIYGVNTQYDKWITWLSPVVWLSNRVYVGRPEARLGWELCGRGWMPLYAGLGLLLSALALLIYRRRPMECAGDTVAFPVLKPIFRYCMALGGALALPASVLSLLLSGRFHGRTAALLLLGLLLLGAALGWYIAEMLIRRTVRVFPGKWKGLALLCAILCLLTLSAEFDLTGFERRTVDPAEVESVLIGAQGNWTLKEPENIRRAAELHRSLTEHKSIHEAEIHYGGTWITLRFQMKDGRSLERAYYLRCYEPPEPEDLDALEDLINCPELLDQRDRIGLPVTEKTVYGAQFSYSWTDPDGRYQYDMLNLTAAEAVDFYYNAVLPDRNAHTLGRIWLNWSGRRLDTLSSVSFHMDLMQPDRGNEAYMTPDPAASAGTLRPTAVGKETMEMLDLEIGMDSEACLAWLREHTEIPLRSIREADVPMA